jgi:hypothetical protein
MTHHPRRCTEQIYCNLLIIILTESLEGSRDSHDTEITVTLTTH